MKDKNERRRYTNQLQRIVIILGQVQANLLSNGIISNWTKFPLIIGKGCKILKIMENNTRGHELIIPNLTNK
jgi:hypothetical protein